MQKGKDCKASQNFFFVNYVSFFFFGVEERSICKVSNWLKNLEKLMRRTGWLRFEEAEEQGARLSLRE